MLLARVAVPVPLGRAFSYRVPAALEGKLVRGARVLCEFGRRKLLGVVLDVAEREPEIDPDKLKDIVSLVDPEPVLPEELLDFLLELARYYIAPIGEVMRLALPAVERSRAKNLASLIDPSKLDAVGKLVKYAVPVAEDTSDGTKPARLRGQARDILDHLRQQGATPLTELADKWGNARQACRKLEDNGLVRLEDREAPSDPFFSEPIPKDAPPALTAAQALALERLGSALDTKESAQFLLDGVTASGKTEVYLRAVVRTLELGRGAIVLVPEIALTPQLVARVRARIGDEIAVLHSGLTDAQRHAMWRLLRSGRVRVAIGARSALFAPVQHLGLICVDEEHDASFKQDDGVRYHGRDMALLRAYRAGAVCVLGSATPSLASEALVRANRLERLELPARAHSASRLPEVQIVDLRVTGPGPSGDRLLSLPLHREVERVLERGHQSILFLNRRGFSPSVICESCGWIAECPNCSVALTYHRVGQIGLVCHYCEYSDSLPANCAKCKSPNVVQEGAGTERIENLLSEAFPKARIGRLDRDVASGAKSERILTKMREGKLDILVGTQMVTKGHDLPNVTLVGVLNADAALSMPDFYATERTFHLLVQVAGRAGRGEAAGKVMVQTRQPEHYAIIAAMHHDVRSFVERELSERQTLNYPPFSRVALVRLDAIDERLVHDQAASFAALARRAAGNEAHVLGPAPAPIARLRNRFRYRFMVRASGRAPLRKVLLAVARGQPDRRVRLSIDVDPVNML